MDITRVSFKVLRKAFLVTLCAGLLPIYTEALAATQQIQGHDAKAIQERRARRAELAEKRKTIVTKTAEAKKAAEAKAEEAQAAATSNNDIEEATNEEVGNE